MALISHDRYYVGGAPILSLRSGRHQGTQLTVTWHEEKGKPENLQRRETWKWESRDSGVV